MANPTAIVGSSGATTTPAKPTVQSLIEGQVNLTSQLQDMLVADKSEGDTKGVREAINRNAQDTVKVITEELKGMENQLKQLQKTAGKHPTAEAQADITKLTGDIHDKATKYATYLSNLALGFEAKSHQAKADNSVVTEKVYPPMDLTAAEKTAKSGAKDITEHFANKYPAAPQTAAAWTAKKAPGENWG